MYKRHVPAIEIMEKKHATVLRNISMGILYSFLFVCCFFVCLFFFLSFFSVSILSTPLLHMQSFLTKLRHVCFFFKGSKD